MYPDTYRSSVIEHTPLHNAPEPKRRFIPSKWEGMRIHRLAQGLADGRLRTREENRRLEEGSERSGTAVPGGGGDHVGSGGC